MYTMTDNLDGFYANYNVLTPNRQTPNNTLQSMSVDKGGFIEVTFAYTPTAVVKRFSGYLGCCRF